MSKELLVAPDEKLNSQRERHDSSQESFPRKSGLSNVLYLQRVLGNRKVAELIRSKQITAEGKLVPIQRKLGVSEAGQQFEQGSERLARRIVSTPDSLLE